MNFFPLDDGELATPPAHSGMRLFLDSAEPQDWQRFLPTGVFYGVTTNPLLLERSGQACTLENLEKLTRLAVDLGAEEIHLQTWGKTSEEMVHTGSQLALMAGLGIDVAVKIPATELGFQVARKLSEAGCAITMTAVYNPGQVMLAAGFGAAYAAPYLGRLNDQGADGLQIVSTMGDILTQTHSSTRLLVASLRSAELVVQLAAQGFDTLTFGSPVAADLLADNLTDAAAADFQRAAETQPPEMK